MIIIRAIIIILAIFLGYIFTTWFLLPTVYNNLCLVNNDQCLQIEYYLYGNTSLIHVVTTDLWLWYTGQYLVIYGTNGELQCDDGYAPVVVYDKNSTIQNLSRYCVRSLAQVKDFYTSVSKKYYIYERVYNPITFDAFQTLQLFYNKNILF